MPVVPPAAAALPIVWVRLEVRDNGRGISDADQERLFRAFVQIDAGALQAGRGTGLGLYICHQIVRRHGGRIGVESQLGAGATFWAEIPVRVVATSARPHPSRGSPHPSPPAAGESVAGGPGGQRAMPPRPATPTAAASTGTAAALPSPRAVRAKPPIAGGVPLPSPRLPGRASPLRGPPLRASPPAVTAPLPPLQVAASSPRVRGAERVSPPAAPQRTGPATVPPSLQHPAPLKRRYLVVDDDRTNRVFLVRALRRALPGVLLDEAADGAAAVQRVTGAPAGYYAGVCLDRSMPVLDGLEAAAQLRAAGYGGVIVGVTGDADAAASAEFVRRGADAVLGKPVRVPELVAVLQRGRAGGGGSSSSGSSRNSGGAGLTNGPAAPAVP
jgi:CheY-like chemotaxis protein